MAILIADLSGYTALTERHGAATAADLIDRYLEMVHASIVGDSYLHERVGDEVMIVSESADDLLETAEILSENLSAENHFLQIHGGLHYGMLLKRKNAFFGTALNVASRIARLAKPGSIICSKDFIDEIDPASVSKFNFFGKSSFKNYSAALETFELQKILKPVYIDPVCRMTVHSSNNVYLYSEGDSLRFCCKSCMEIYSSRLRTA